VSPVLRDRRILIAGGAGAERVLAAVAEHALRGGAFVTLAAPPARFAGCRALVEQLPWGAHAVGADLASEGDVARLREHLRCAYRGLDAAVYVARDGGEPRREARAFAALCRAAAPLLTSDGGALVGVASGAGTAEALSDRAAALVGDPALRGARVDVAVPASSGDEHAVAGTVCLLLGDRAGAALREAASVG